VAAYRQRWRTPLIMVLAATAGVATGSALSWRGLVGLAVLAGVVVTGMLVVWVVVAPGRLAPAIPAQELAQITDPKARLEAADARLRLRHDLRTGTLQTLVVVAVLAGAVLGFQQLAEDRATAAADRELTRQGQASERFTRAINQLSDKRVETRIGGIYGLAQVAKQAPDNNRPVGEVLLAWINRLARPKKPPTAPLSEHAPDVQAALTALTQHDKDENGIKDYAWLVGRLDLHALSLIHADFDGADLHGANLAGADLRLADLRGANLSHAFLGVADLHGADLTDADLTDAVLGSANLSNADLDGANLGATDLRSANLGAADLSRANLGAADLSRANLSGANLSGADLSGARADDRTLWPVGFDWRRAGVQPA
jgi:hypothetical protein